MQKTNGVKILVIDDDEAILDAVSLAVSSEGYDVQTLTNGEEAIEKARQYAPTLILLDYLLSGRDGAEIVKELKSNEELKNIPVVIFSAHPSARETAMASGANSYLSKPFDIDDLFSVIEKYTLHTDKASG